MPTFVKRELLTESSPQTLEAIAFLGSHCLPMPVALHHQLTTCSDALEIPVSVGWVCNFTPWAMRNIMFSVPQTWAMPK